VTGYQPNFFETVGRDGARLTLRVHTGFWRPKLLFSVCGATLR
jgi:hypothetical protein